jgi:virginiamycin A acetyltransferase
MIKGIFIKVILKFIPQLLSIIKGDVALHWIENVEKNVKKEELAKLHGPYNVVDCEIGKGSYISSNSKIVNTKIGKFCSIGPNFISGWGIHPTNGISTSPYFYSTAKQNGSTLASENLCEERKPITIGNDVFIGANVIVLDGVKIGDGAIIGAGAVVSKDIPPYAIAVGSPIQIKKYRFSEEQIRALLKIKWWNFKDEKLKDIHSMFFDIDEFIRKYNKGEE